MQVLIAGGSGGIGLALIDQLLQQPDVHITASYRRQPPSFSHPRLQWQQADLTDEAQVQALTQSITHLDLVINACGVLHSNDKLPEKALTEFTPAFFFNNLQSNTLIAILLAKHCQAALKRSGRSHFVCLSARIGSISDNHKGGWLSYRSAKAALNMALKTIAIEWRRTLPNCCVIALHPGTVATPLSQPFQARVPAAQLQAPEQCAKALLAVIASRGASDSGAYLDYRGEIIPW
ncbi:SDR family NAD(P)-dependent oxidoreductase [Ferrimonas senticii]|uniref:SDR family NAD(P)-dependent oxidoreductase n=1 Tax=Ferrimonas senticii TaxID=394566 RepID=UPI00041A00F5|nr:SDR family NAD(P)-dependent oxidoreductase [Ferrimonas senticii]